MKCKPYVTCGITDCPAKGPITAYKYCIPIMNKKTLTHLARSLSLFFFFSSCSLSLPFTKPSSAYYHEHKQAHHVPVITP